MKPSVFERLGPKVHRTSVFQRLGAKHQMSKRKMVPAKLLCSPKGQWSLIPSRMKRCTDLIVQCGEVLKVKERTIVYTKVKEEDAETRKLASSYHVTFEEGESAVEEDAENAPPELEEGIKTTVDDLKERNLGTARKLAPRPIYVSTLLDEEEEVTYVQLLKEYKDVFAWTYKEMPGLDVKVAVHRLAVKKDARPVKQAPRHFRPDLVPLIESDAR